jgi:hypothetical protein
LVAEPRSGGDHAQLLMERAAGDEKILFPLIDEDDIPDDGLGFHAQQAVEKMIKAVLAQNEVSYERTHNIAYLLNLLYEARLTPIWAALPNDWRRSPLRYGVGVASPEPTSKASTDAAVAAEAVRVQRLQSDARRPMSVNLAETIALSHQLLQFAGAARRG